MCRSHLTAQANPMPERLQPICVRLDKQLIEELKFIAQYRGTQYQPMIRRVLSVEAQRLMLEIVMQMQTELASSAGEKLHGG